jgi:hypothetical protein
MARIEIELSELLGDRKVDLRTAQELSRYFREEVVRGASTANRFAGGRAAGERQLGGDGPAFDIVGSPAYASRCSGDERRGVRAAEAWGQHAGVAGGARRMVHDFRA